jgi:hypothetical protein
MFNSDKAIETMLKERQLIPAGLGAT